ncbi:T9SS type A sorting domain-containing protein [Bacteroidia bacterium]|nr:T9SS type A sorting domain-containing protein [Bacteroidia bacterium]
MKKLVALSIICFSALLSNAQLFEISSDPVFQKANGDVYTLALSGGLNQPQFSNLDFNNDGKLDLFVFDKEGNKVLVFVSQTTGNTIKYRYAPEYEAFFPNGEEFMRLADYDKDGKPDLWTFSTGKERGVYIYKNTSMTVMNFSSMGRQFTQDNVSPDAAGNYTERNFTHIGGCQPAIVDLDGDEDVDFVTNLNLNGSQMMLVRNVSADDELPLRDLKFETVDKCYGGIDEKSGDMITNATCFFYEAYKKKHASSKTLLFFDNDDDGDMDLFYGNSEKENTPIYFFHNDRVELNFYKDTFTSIDTNYFSSTINRQMPTAPNMSYVDIDLDGELDLILSTNEGDKTSYPIRETNNILLFINDGVTDNPSFNFQQNDFLSGKMLDFGSHTAPAFGDLDGDGDVDLVIATNGNHYLTGDTSDRLVYFQNIGDKTNPIFKLITEDYLGLSTGHYRGLRPAFADLDGDGDLDLYLGKRDGSIAEFVNSGTSSNPMIALTTENFGNIVSPGNAAPCFYDLNGDGTQDLLLGSYSGKIAYYTNEGTQNVPSFNLKNNEFGNISVNQMILVSKINPDGTLGDTLVPAPFGNATPQVVKWSEKSRGISVGSEEGVVRLFEVPKDLTSSFAEEKDYMVREIALTPYTLDYGAKTIPAAADLDGDGISDLLVGNSRGGVGYLKGNEREVNSVSRVTKQQERFVLAPNPAQSSITIFTESNNPFAYEIYHLSGKVVARGHAMTGQSIQLNNSISNGAYFVQLMNETNFFATQKLIISK